MKPLTIVGILLIVVGLAALAYQGISYTTREKVVDIGPIEITDTDKHTIPLPPIVGFGALGAGIVCVVMGARKR